jgi:hypothetical protein
MRAVAAQARCGEGLARAPVEVVDEGEGGLGGTDGLEPGKRLGGDCGLHQVEHRLVITGQPQARQMQRCRAGGFGGLPEGAHRAQYGRPGKGDLAQLDRASGVR